MSSLKGPKHTYARLYMNYLIVFALEDIEKIKMKKLHWNSLNNHTSVYKFWNSFYFPSMKIHQQAKLARNYKILPFEFSKPLKGIFDKAVKINCTIADWTEKRVSVRLRNPLCSRYRVLFAVMAQICFNFFHQRCKKTALT